jgi:hypothetical protein
MQKMFCIADLIACSTCFGHHYANQQELESIIQLVAGFRTHKPQLQTIQTTLKPITKTTGGNQLYNTLELLMIDIMVSETC